MIRALAEQGFALSQIASTIGVSRQRVHQIVNSPVKDPAHNGRPQGRNPERMGACANGRTIVARDSGKYIARCDACSAETKCGWSQFLSNGCGSCHYLWIMTPGDRYGRWTVINDPCAGKRKVLVKCDCGATHNIAAQRLRGGESVQCKACGFADRRERMAARSACHITPKAPTLSAAPKSIRVTE